MAEALHHELSDHDRLIAMHAAASEIRDTIFRTETLIDQTRSMLRKVETYAGVLINRR
jgi:hypothetical protein